MLSPESPHQPQAQTQPQKPAMIAGLDRKIEQVTAGLPPRYSKHLQNIAAINDANAVAIQHDVQAAK